MKGTMKATPKEKLTIKVMGSSTISSLYREFLAQVYPEAIIEYLVFDASDEKKEVHLLLFTGGADVTPEMYGERKGSHTHVNAQRDDLEIKMVNKYSKKPKLGVCRGAQFLTVRAGGTLIQHVEGHNTGVHPIQTHEFAPEGHFISYPMSSSHHQMMFPDRISNKESYKLLAWSKFFNSNTYLNGDGNEIILPDDFLEPEIVHYPGINALAIQGHPEYPGVDQKTVNFCAKLIKKYL
tara:strand:+ start:25877 stop:26587 length:711 start_codon:yes stop_codon:yes gene_type:complete